MGLCNYIPTIKLEHRLNSNLDPQDPLETKCSGATLEIQHKRKGRTLKVTSVIRVKLIPSRCSP